jgi:hypothetical protein
MTELGLKPFLQQRTGTATATAKAIADLRGDAGHHLRPSEGRI